MPKLKLEGIFVPHITPFERNGEIDTKALRKLVQFWIDGGLSGLVTCGSNGEAPFGGKGVVIAVANVAPKLCSELYDAFKDGDCAKAWELQKKISHINEVLVIRHNQLAAIKEVLNIMNLPAGYPRKPTLPLNEREKAEIRKFIEKVNLN